MGRNKEKLGLMSKKMMLLRSRTGSGHGHNGSISRSTPSQGSMRDPDFVPSSPVLQDVGNLAPEKAQEPEFLRLPESDRRSNSGGSSSSDISGMTAFLAKYGKPEGTSDDEALYENGESPAQAKSQNNGPAESEVDAERRRQQQEEYNSAVLSKRAEQILANAKKRLNVMEGNLRGARDLVAPLTAANLKRATSLGSAASFTPVYSRRYAPNGYDYDGPSQTASRMLHTQYSSPSMARDYLGGHSRGFSETELPERPYTSLEHQRLVIPRSRTPGGRGHDIVPTYGALRGSRSYDSLGSGIGYSPIREHPLHRDSPDSNHLDPLPEDDEVKKTERPNHEHMNHERGNSGLGIYRPSSRTSDLREQMSNLKGKISTLKERAREDSLRRQSQSSLRNPSPFNNALATAPEFFYSSGSGYGSPVLDTNAGVGRTPTETGSPVSSRPDYSWHDDTPPMGGSRNAFAEQAATQNKPYSIQEARAVEIVQPKTPDSKFQVRPPKTSQPQLPPPTNTVHRRTASGTAIIGSAKNRYSHHQHKHSQDSQISSAYTEDQTDEENTEDEEDYLGVPSPEMTRSQYDSSPIASDVDTRSEQSYAESEDNMSVYEDAQNDASVVRHEDREDAFDYEHFFLHSALGTYGGHRDSDSDSETSTTSVETARGPALVGEEESESFNQDSGIYPPPTPETPEQLREIEREMDRRRYSDESVTTMNSYATADEGAPAVSPDGEPHRRLGSWERGAVSPVSEFGPQAQPGAQSRSRPASRPNSRPASRPGTAVKRIVRRGSSSDRADSGVGMGSNDSQKKNMPPAGSTTPKPNKPRSQGSIVGINTPPMSPSGVTKQDPATLAVNALLDPDGKPLGLRNKAVLFGVVESLRKVVHQLQEEDESHYDSRMLRRRLDEAKQALDGLAGH